MATTRLMPLHTGKGRTVGQAISDIIDYTENPQKTDGGRLITSWQCDSRIADAEFLFTKNQYIQKTGRVRGEYCCISKSERDCIIEAKRIIDSELAFAPSCEGLARQVQISVSKLSRGFSMMYGISVHAYVIEQRLERAAGLLLESNMNIGQIAVLVGYTKPSNFSAAFKKKYGVMPKDYREASRIK